MVSENKLQTVLNRPSIRAKLLVGWSSPRKEAAGCSSRFLPLFHIDEIDGSFDSICLKCLVTIGYERTDQEGQLFGRCGEDERKPDRGCGLAFIEVLQCV
jgi:hypothetical protein